MGRVLVAILVVNGIHSNAFPLAAGFGMIGPLAECCIGQGAGRNLSGNMMGHDVLHGSQHVRSSHLPIIYR